MRIDRYLLPTAIILFFLQLVWLGVDLQMISLPFLGKSHSGLSEPSMGQVISVQNKVRQKSLSEIVWTEARESQDVRAMDAVLTLSESSTRIRLNNGSELNLGENTLVYLEPVDNVGDGRIRIHFAHGQLRSLAGKSAAPIKTESWVLTANSHSEVQLKSREDGEIEVQVTKGEVQAESADKKVIVNEGEVAALKKDAEIESFKMSQKLVWKHAEPYRVYAHLFPEKVNLQWEGPAQKLRINTKTSQNVADVSGRQSLSLVFQRGTYELRLQNESELSPTLVLEVWQAPLIHLVSPLPRDRYRVNEPIEYFWTRPEGVSDFAWIMQSLESDLLEKKKTSSSSLKSSMSRTGPYRWWIEGYDSDGVRIPAPYNNPIFIEPQPLEAPKLNSPILRAPAEEPSSPKPQSWWQLLTGPKLAQARPQAIQFSWHKVEGAEFYIIEISAQPDFREPIVEQKIAKTDFVWNLEKFKGKAFYWRVAAGNSEQKGRFSEAQEVVVAKINANTPGIKIVKETSKSLPPKKLPPKEALPPLAAAKPEPPPAPPEEPKAVEPPSTAKAASEPERDYSRERTLWLFSAGYEITSQSSPDSKIKFAGLVPSIFWQQEGVNGDHRHSWDVQITMGSWRSTLDNISDDSKKLTDLRLRGRYIYGPKTSPWMKGVTLSSVPFAERNGLEGLLLKSQTLLGAALVYDGMNFRWSNELNIGTEAQELRSQFQTETHFGQSKQWIWVSIFEASYMNTSPSVRGVRGSVQTGISYEW